MSNDNGAHVEAMGTGTPPTTPNLGLPRYSGADPADYPTQTNAISDLLDTHGRQTPRRRHRATHPRRRRPRAGPRRASAVCKRLHRLGLSAPLGLWNLSDLTDASGNGRALQNKGAVPFGPGINGAASTAAVFAGSTAQALYISDTGAADPFRIKTGSWGCWFRTAKRGSAAILSWRKHALRRRAVGWWNSRRNHEYGKRAGLTGLVRRSGAQAACQDVCDDRWHFVVGTHDGAACAHLCRWRLGSHRYPRRRSLPANGPLNLGAMVADGRTAATIAPLRPRR